MTNQPKFGRRSSCPPQQRLRANVGAAVTEAKPVFSNGAVDQSSLLRGAADLRYIKSEPPEGEPSVLARLKMPWRQLALMASVSFGIASFVLPEETNDALQWILYGLMAMSLYAALSGRPQS